MKNLKSHIKSNKPAVVDLFAGSRGLNKIIGPAPKEVKENRDEGEDVIKMDVYSQYRLLLFLMKVV